MSNLKTIQEMYEAFGRGDIPTILSKLSNTIEWEYGGADTNVPWLKPRHGTEGAAAFFDSLAELEFHKFVPTHFFEAENVVVVLLDVEFKVKKNGESVAEKDQTHVWRFDAQGKVTGFRHGADTHKHHLAYNK